MYKLSFEHISLQYENADRKGESTHALQDVNLHIAPAESVSIIGPSGCGKSSMLQIAAGLLKPSEGTALIDGVAIDGPRHKTALILQDFGLLPWKTVLKNAELGLKVRGVSSEKRHERALEALALVDLEDFAHVYPEELSGGMQQRLALARSLALDVDLLLMDEPLSALDAILREQLQDTLLDLWQKEAYAQMLVTHSIEEAVYLGQRIVVFSGRPGRVVSVIENPSAGNKEYRQTGEYYALCNEVRAILHEALEGEARHA